MMCFFVRSLPTKNYIKLQYAGMSRARAPVRACTTNARSFKELYDEEQDFTSFLFSDEEESGSDLEDESLDEDD